jgi:L-2-hydroxyglutarate oxidase LhgO
MSDLADVAIVGAGVVGAAVAQRLAADRNMSCFVLDRRARTGGETTERNSGVIHAGLYYPLASLKTQLSIEGNRRLYEWARRTGVAHRRLGKLVVATDEAEEAALVALEKHAREAGVPELRLIGAAELSVLEPSVRGRSALFSGSTGIVDPVELTESLIASAKSHGAEVVTNAKVLAIEAIPGGWRLTTERGEISAARLINAAGLYADRVAALAGVDRYTIHPCRGDYFRLKKTRDFRHLIYPVKKKGAPGLGVHLTIDTGGHQKLGPDTTWIEARDDYSPPPDDRRAQFAAAARKLFDLEPDDLEYDSSGIRPKLRAPHETEERDFVISEDGPGLINLVGIESPGLTAALAIARLVSDRLA